MDYSTAQLISIVAVVLGVFITYRWKKNRDVEKVVVTLKDQEKTLSTLWKIEQIVVNTLDFAEVAQQITDAVLLELGKYGYVIIVLSLIDPKKRTLKRISISQTKEAKLALEITPVPFHDIAFSLQNNENLCVRAINENKQMITGSLSDVLSPVIPKEFVDKAQQALGVKTSIVSPIASKKRLLGSLIFSVTKDQSAISEYEWEIMRGYVDAVGIALENSLLYSDVKRIGEELKSANEKLTELDKLKDEFVSLASHELRTPMTAIKGSLSTILDGYAGDISKESRDFLTAAYNENDRLIRLVNNLLNISRIEAGRFTFTVSSIDLGKLASEVVNNLQMAAKEKNMYLTYEKSGVLPLAAGDEDKVKEVFINFIGNALKFTWTGGITVRISPKEGELVVAVSDTGPGITKEDQDVLFKKFSQAQQGYTKQTGGTGLGLYISKQIIEGLHGKIWLESEIGKGSTFYFTLPMAS